MKKVKALVVMACFCLLSCTPTPVQRTVIPALNYARKVKLQSAGEGVAIPPQGRSEFQSVRNGYPPQVIYPEAERASLRYVKDWPEEKKTLAFPEDDLLTNMGDPGQDPGVEIYRSQQPNIRDYTGPLALGNPGSAASLWQESRRGNNIYRDDRAWQPMDLVTIIVSESTEGKKEADTDVSGESSLKAALSKFFGVEKFIGKRNPDMDFTDLVNGSTTSEYKGEGETTRKGTLKGKISAMVVEVLPGGILRIEGEKILSVNQEEQVMVISGLVRPRDISSNNEIDSSKIAQLRIDYYGKGVIGDVQEGGWFMRIMSKVWPF